ncbi:MAG: hypothetical protein O3B24_00435 [Verrucomicrobia bacterium]|nr:hypothetical protein [Verrucomicrobiota bacterium]
MKRLPVYVDFDDVICETARELAVLLHQEFGKTVAFEDIFAFNLGQSFGLDSRELDHLMARAHEDAFLERLAPVPGALEAMRRWSDAGVEIHVMTGRPSDTAAVSADWLIANGVTHARLAFVDKYGRAQPGGAVPTLSLAELQQLDFALAVEDAPQMADYLVRNHPWPVAVIERPWNRHAEIGGAATGLHRCRDWSQILECFPAPGIQSPP